MHEKLAIIGAASFAKEVYSQFNDQFSKDNIYFFVDDQYIDNSKKKLYNRPILPISYLKENLDNFILTVAIGDPKSRRNVIEKNNLENAKFINLIHRLARLLNRDIYIKDGCIICCNSILTCNITIGKQAHINLNTTIGHDCCIGDYFTTAPGVNISGNCTIGDNVYLGTNCSIREKISICSDVTIGMGSVVVKDITVPGTYIGVPARAIER